MRRFAPACLALLSVLGLPRQSSAQLHQEGIIRTFEPPVTAGPFANRGDGVAWEHVIDIPDTLWMRVHFNDVTETPNSNYSVVLRDRNQRTVARYTGAEFAQRREHLTPVLFTNRVFVHVEGNPGSLQFNIDYVVHELDAAGRLAPMTSVPNWRTVPEAAGITKDTRLVAQARSIAKLYIGNGAVCTGFLIAANIILTNHHCLAESNDFQRSSKQPMASRGCGDIETHFDFDQQGAPTQVLRSSCVAVKDFDEALDFAALAIDADRIKSPAPRTPLTLSGIAKPFAGPLYVIHHPAGLAKKVSFQCQAFASKDSAVIDHDCSTVGGSSGAPLFDESGQVVALHFNGAVPRTMTFAEFERRLMRGEIFRNKARPMSALAARLAPLTGKP